MNIIYTLYEKKDQAEETAHALLDKKLICCANIHEVTSINNWEGKRNTGVEWAMIAKTTPEKTTEAEQTIKETHPYDTPCILSWDVKANKEYEKWVRGL